MKLETEQRIKQIELEEEISNLVKVFKESVDDATAKAEDAEYDSGLMVTVYLSMRECEWIMKNLRKFQP